MEKKKHSLCCWRCSAGVLSLTSSHQRRLVAGVGFRFRSSCWLWNHSFHFLHLWYLPHKRANIQRLINHWCRSLISQLWCEQKVSTLQTLIISVLFSSNMVIFLTTLMEILKLTDAINLLMFWKQQGVDYHSLAHLFGCLPRQSTLGAAAKAVTHSS